MGCSDHWPLKDVISSKVALLYGGLLGEHAPGGERLNASLTVCTLLRPTNLLATPACIIRKTRGNLNVTFSSANEASTILTVHNNDLIFHCHKVLCIVLV